MRIHPKKGLVMALCALALVPCARAVRAPSPGAPSARMAEGEAAGDEAPLGPDFSRGGLRPMTTDFSHLGAAYRARRAQRKAGPLRLRAAALPSSWDSRDRGWITSVKNQGSYGTCWTFSTMAALETALVKNAATNDLPAVDLSENHLATHDVGFALSYDDGGNNQIAAALLLSWRDPLREEDDPYGNPSSACETPPVRHVQDIVWLPVRAGRDNDDILKEAVMNYGAVSIGYYHSANCWNETWGTHYCTTNTFQTSGNSGGHAVTLIGWDDDYPAANFNNTPPGNGAFLCKNSWGPTAGTNGCLWISYYDEFFCCMASAAYPVPEGTNNFGRVFQYDPCGQVTTWNVYTDKADQASGGKTNWCANVFLSSVTGLVEAVGFYALTAGTSYELRIYGGCGVAPSSGTLRNVQTGLVENAGYVTVRLTDAVPIDIDERFAVALRLETPGYDYPLPVTSTYYEDGELWCTNVAQAGESFLSPDGVTWTDFQDFPDATRTENLCIKAYTRYGADGARCDLFAAVSPENTRVTTAVGETTLFTVTAAAAEEAVTFTWELDGEAVGTGSTYAFAPIFAQRGTHMLRCRAQRGENLDSRLWTVVVAAALNVDVSSTAAAPDGSAEKPFASITAALAAAVEGDEILVAPGVYAEALAPRVTVTIRAKEGPAVTFLERGSGYCCYYGVDAPATLLTGFTLRGGNARYGAGVYGGTVSNCVITACEANLGGGAYQATLFDCTLCDNTVYGGYGFGSSYGYGGGAYDCQLTRCILYGNQAAREGGGADSSDLVGCVISNNVAQQSGGGASYGALEGCLVVGNQALSRDGGGTYECTLVNCTVAGNAAASGYGGGAYAFNYDLFNTVVAENTAYYGSDVYGNAYWRMTCTLSDQDARFVDSARGNWHLRYDSPAIDAGSNAFVTVTCDLDGKNRIFGSHVDMGCYEYVPRGTHILLTRILKDRDGRRTFCRLTDAFPPHARAAGSFPRNTP